MDAKLKKLTQQDVENISDFFAGVIEKKISSSVKSQKEILTMDINLDVSYNDENEELDVDVDVDIEVDELSKLTDEIVDEAIEQSYLELDEYINNNFRE
ncbi:MAG: DUF3194 domain-containing protein [Methanobrevibacter sp.]|nr:DUF3194 domain-containing protein [Methanobrevibacter sp.]